MLKTYLADDGPSATERLVFGNLVPSEVAERTREERLHQTMVQINLWSQLCKEDRPSSRPDPVEGLEKGGCQNMLGRTHLWKVGHGKKGELDTEHE